MAFWAIVIGAAVYLVCNLITGKNEAVQRVINCFGTMGLVTFGAGVLVWLTLVTR